MRCLPQCSERGFVNTSRSDDVCDLWGVMVTDVCFAWFEDGQSMSIGACHVLAEESLDHQYKCGLGARSGMLRLGELLFSWTCLKQPPWRVFLCTLMVVEPA